MTTLKLLFTFVLLNFILVGCNQKDKDHTIISSTTDKADITSKKVAYKKSIREILKIYEPEDLIVLFGGQITMNLNTGEFEADNIWKMADEQPQEFIDWYENEILPKSKLLDQNSSSKKTYNGSNQNDADPNLEETITWIGSKISKYAVNNVFDKYESHFQDLSLSPEKLEYTFVTRDKEVIGSRSYVTNEETITYIIPLEEIDKISINEEWDDGCLLTFQSNSKQIQYINKTTGKKSFENERGIRIQCDAEPNLEKRLQEAFKHLEKYRTNKSREAF